MVSLPFTTIHKDRVQQHTTHEGQRNKLGCFEFVFFVDQHESNQQAQHKFTNSWIILRKLRSPLMRDFRFTVALSAVAARERLVS